MPVELRSLETVYLTLMADAEEAPWSAVAVEEGVNVVVVKLEDDAEARVVSEAQGSWEAQDEREDRCRCGGWCGAMKYAIENGYYRLSGGVLCRWSRQFHTSGRRWRWPLWTPLLYGWRECYRLRARFLVKWRLRSQTR